MSHVLDPVVITPPNPVGLVRALVGVQQALALVPWLGYVYGLATNDVKKPLAPAVYTGDVPDPVTGAVIRRGEYLRLVANDRVRAWSFFEEEAARVNTSPPGALPEWRATVGLVVVADLNRLRADGFFLPEQYPAPPVEEFTAAVLRALRGAPAFKFARLSTVRADVVGKYDQRLYSGVFPQLAIRISGLVSFRDAC